MLEQSFVNADETIGFQDNSDSLTRQEDIRVGPGGGKGGNSEMTTITRATGLEQPVHENSETEEEEMDTSATLSEII